MITYQGWGTGLDTGTLVPKFRRGSLVVKDGDGNLYGFGLGVEELNIRNPGKISFVCNDLRQVVIGYHAFGVPEYGNGYANNKGAINASIAVYPSTAQPPPTQP